MLMKDVSLLSPGFRPHDTKVLKKLFPTERTLFYLTDFSIPKFSIENFNKF
jgi:hypothetical protein